MKPYLFSSPRGNKIFLSVVIPAYNEEQNIKGGAPDKVLSYLKKQKYSWEAIFVDDGSQDKTASLLEVAAKGGNDVQVRGRIRIIKNPHQGKAATVTTGVLAARGEIILFTDMDQATPISEIEKFLPVFKNGYDVVIGSRNGREGAPLFRKLMAAGFALLRNLILGLPFSDTQCGFKAFTNETVQQIFPNLNIHGPGKEIRGAAVTAGFDTEVLFLAKKGGFKIAEVPVNWHYQKTGRIRILKDSIDGLKGILAIRRVYGR